MSFTSPLLEDGQILAIPLCDELTRFSNRPRCQKTAGPTTNIRQDEEDGRGHARNDKTKTFSIPRFHV
jgi:hypothetical protein